MNGVAEEFRAKAEADLATAKREMAASVDFNADAVCFHSQQCIEKLMKAVLVKRGSDLVKTHNLLFLYEQIEQSGAVWKPDLNDLRLLQTGAVDYRYPGSSADIADARDTLAACERLRIELNTLLGEPE